jgi:hypothetical protein
VDPDNGNQDATIQLSGIHLTGGLYKATVNDVTTDPSAETAELQINVVANLGNPTVSPTTATKNVGDTHAITVSVTGGVLPLSYQWELEQNSNPGVWIPLDTGVNPAVDALVTDATSATLNINVNSEPLLEGKFRCIVSDSGIWTKTSTQSTLNITNFLGTGTLVGANAYTGESVQLTLNVFGATPPYTVEWFKNGGASPILTQNGAGPAFVLNLSPADASDIGNYNAEVTSTDVQTDTSNTVAIDVRALPAATTPGDVSGYFGNVENFSTTASGGYAPYSYEWRLGGSPIIGAPNANAYARTLLATDNGALISVEVTDAGGDTGPKSAVSGDAEITAAAAPVVTITSAGFRGYVDDAKPTQTLTVVGGLGSLSYEWFVDGTDITTLGGTVAGGNGDLTLPNSSVTGTLTATVSDSIGSADSTNSVQVEIVDHLTGVVVNDATGGDGNPFSNPRILQGEGLSPITTEWFKDDGSKVFQPLVPAQSGSSIVFTPLTFADAGTYQVTVEDDGTDGPFSDTFVLTVVEGVPVGGGLGLAALALMSSLGGALALRRRKK